jgi:CheY-like chemotaxis protein
VLEDAGINVLTAHDGDQALELLRENDVDLISLDLVMPRKSGIRLFMELRKIDKWSKIPVIFVTGHANDPDVRRDVGQVMEDKTMVGPSLYLEKPVEAEQYVAFICEQLGVEHEGEPSMKDADKLRGELQELMKGVDPERLAEAVRLLKKR